MRIILLIAVFVGPSMQDMCTKENCKLPNCRCYNDETTPGDLEISDVPQIVTLSFEGTINQERERNYRALLQAATNPNGCPIGATFFITDEGTQYSTVKTLYDEGNEIGIQFDTGKGSTKGFRTVKRKLTDIGVKAGDIKGVRAVGFENGGDEQLISMVSNDLLYDSSCSNAKLSDASRMIWPYTFDYVPGASCDSGITPNIPIVGMWEMIVTVYHDLTNQKSQCVIPSACPNITTKTDAFNLFYNAFEAHYNGKRTPFNMIVDPTSAATEYLRDGAVEFLQYIRATFVDSVWIVPMHKTIQWIQDPTPIGNLATFEPWSCS